MNKATLFGMLTAAALVSTASLALAEGTPQKAQPQQQEHYQGQASTLAQEQVEGRVVAVDKSKGTVSIETAQHGQLEFKLTAAQLQKLNEGEQLRLQIQIHSMSKQQQEQPKQQPKQ